jgi:tetratricopeptide (TPR) repeat protein
MDHAKRTEIEAAAWRRLIELIRGPERAPALVSLGALCIDHLDDLKEASSCFRRAMGDDPRNVDAIDGLISIATTQGRWPLLAELYQRRFDLTSGARQRTKIALEAGRMHQRRLQNLDSARGWYNRARELNSDNPAVHEALVGVARLAGDEDALRCALDDLVDLSGESTPMALLLEAAESWRPTPEERS